MTDELKNKIQSIRQADNEISGRKIELKKRIHDFIVEILQECKGQIIDFTIDDSFPLPIILHDDVQNFVYDVHINECNSKTTFVVNCEDCEDYSAKNLDYDEMVQIFESVVNKLYTDSIEYNDEVRKMVVINHATHEATFLVGDTETIENDYQGEEEDFIKAALGLTDKDMEVITWDWVVKMDCVEKESVKTL